MRSLRCAVVSSKLSVRSVRWRTTKNSHRLPHERPSAIGLSRRRSLSWAQLGRPPRRPRETPRAALRLRGVRRPSALFSFLLGRRSLFRHSRATGRLLALCAMRASYAPGGQLRAASSEQRAASGAARWASRAVELRCVLRHSARAHFSLFKVKNSTAKFL